MKRAWILIAILAVTLLNSVIAADVVQLSETHVYEINKTYALTNTGSLTAEDVRVDLLIGVASDSPYQQYLGYQLVPMAKTVTTDMENNLHAALRLSSLKPGARAIIIVKTRFTNSAIDYSNAIYSSAFPVEDQEAVRIRRKYLGASDGIQSDDPMIIHQAQAFNVYGTVMRRAAAIYDFVNLNLTYDTNPAYAYKGAVNALATGRGICEEFATLFVALCRAVDIPARVVAGYWLQGAVPPGQALSIGAESHAWAEFYLAGVGWIPVEPSFFYSINGKRQPDQDHFARIQSDDRHFIASYWTPKTSNYIEFAYSYQSSSSTRGKQPILEVEMLDESIICLDAKG